MKWVHIGIGQAAILVVVAAYLDKDHRSAIIAGGTFAAGAMYLQYIHARNAGLKNPGPSTESGVGLGGYGLVRR